jgi:hypothetical protein
VILSESLDDPSDLTLLDEVAALTSGDVPEWETARARYEGDPRLRVDNSVMSYVDGGMVSVAIG